jgi:hypothetical protein
LKRGSREDSVFEERKQRGFSFWREVAERIQFLKRGSRGDSVFEER